MKLMLAAGGVLMMRKDEMHATECLLAADAA